MWIPIMCMICPLGKYLHAFTFQMQFRRLLLWTRTGTGTETETETGCLWILRRIGRVLILETETERARDWEEVVVIRGEASRVEAISNSLWQLSTETTTMTKTTKTTFRNDSEWFCRVSNLMTFRVAVVKIFYSRSSSSFSYRTETCN